MSYSKEDIEDINSGYRRLEMTKNAMRSNASASEAVEYELLCLKVSRTLKDFPMEEAVITSTDFDYLTEKGEDWLRQGLVEAYAVVPKLPIGRDRP